MTPRQPSNPRPDQTAVCKVGCTLAMALASLLTVSIAPAEIEILPLDQHLNGSETLAQLGDLTERARAATFLVYEQGEQGGEPVALGTWVGHGLGLTKNSQLDPEAELWLATDPDQPRHPATLITRNEALDLALVRWNPATATAEIKAVRLPDEPTKVDMGHWLVSATLDARRPVMLGVVAAAQRAVPSSGAILGLELSEPDDDGKVRIINASPGGPAYAAGLRRGDVLTRFNDQGVSDGRALMRFQRRLKPGDWVRLSVLRGSAEQSLDFRVRLVSRSQVERFWFGEHWTEGGISPRSDDYPDSIHHSTPVPAHQMGGAVFDLEGRWLGLNIARFDRVTTFALPVASFRTWLEQQLEKLSE